MSMSDLFPSGPERCRAGDELTFMTCTCGHNQAFHWAHRGACEACACLYFKLRKKAAS